MGNLTGRLESDSSGQTCMHSPLEHVILCHRLLRFTRHIFKVSSSARQQSLQQSMEDCARGSFFKQSNVGTYYIHDCLFQSHFNFQLHFVVLDRHLRPLVLVNLPKVDDDNPEQCLFKVSPWLLRYVVSAETPTGAHHHCGCDRLMWLCF